MKNTTPKKPRGDWNGIKPYTRVVQSKKVYDRKKTKQEARTRSHGYDACA